MQGERIRHNDNTEKIRFRVLPDCFSFPLRKVLSLSLEGSIDVAMHGPIQANVSKDLARMNCTSLVWRSRAVTSLKQV